MGAVGLAVDVRQAQLSNLSRCVEDLVHALFASPVLLHELTEAAHKVFFEKNGNGSMSIYDELYQEMWGEMRRCNNSVQLNDLWESHFKEKISVSKITRKYFETLRDSKSVAILFAKFWPRLFLGLFRDVRMGFLPENLSYVKELKKSE